MKTIFKPESMVNNKTEVEMFLYEVEISFLHHNVIMLTSFDFLVCLKHKFFKDKLYYK